MCFFLSGRRICPVLLLSFAVTPLATLPGNAGEYPPGIFLIMEDTWRARNGILTVRELFLPEPDPFIYSNLRRKNDLLKGPFRARSQGRMGKVSIPKPEARKTLLFCADFQVKSNLRLA